MLAAAAGEVPRDRSRGTRAVQRVPDRRLSVRRPRRARRGQVVQEQRGLVRQHTLRLAPQPDYGRALTGLRNARNTGRGEIPRQPTVDTRLYKILENTCCKFSKNA